MPPLKIKYSIIALNVRSCVHNREPLHLGPFTYSYRELDCQSLYTFNQVIRTFLYSSYVYAQRVSVRVTLPLAWPASISPLERA